MRLASQIPRFSGTPRSVATREVLNSLVEIFDRGGRRESRALHTTLDTSYAGPSVTILSLDPGNERTVVEGEAGHGGWQGDRSLG